MNLNFAGTALAAITPVMQQIPPTVELALSPATIAAALLKPLLVAAGFDGQLAKAVATERAPIAPSQTAAPDQPTSQPQVSQPEQVAAISADMAAAPQLPSMLLPRAQPDDVDEKPAAPTHRRGAPDRTALPDATATVSQQPAAVPTVMTLPVPAAPASPQSRQQEGQEEAAATEPRIATGHAMPAAKPMAVAIDSPSAPLAKAASASAADAATAAPAPTAQVAQQHAPMQSPVDSMPPAILAAMAHPPQASTSTTIAAPMTALPSAAPAMPAASPVTQLAPAIVSLGHAPDGTQRLTMRLEPPELGQVQVRIERPPDAPARVEITVERTETLNLLLHDQPQLQRALDQAGVPNDGRSVTFHVAAPDAAVRFEATSVPTSGGAATSGFAGEFSHGAAHQGSDQTRQGTDTDASGDGDGAPVPLPVWLRAGLDITA